jgi:hypothetical protein
VLCAYLKNSITNDKMELPEDIREDLTKSIYVGVIKLSDGHLLTGSTPNITYIDAVELNSPTEQGFKELNIKLTQIKYLTKLVDTKDGNQKRCIIP